MAEALPRGGLLSGTVRALLPAVATGQLLWGAGYRRGRDVNDPAGTERYPFLTCEIGGGMMSSYHRRILVDPRDIEATVARTSALLSDLGLSEDRSALAGPASAKVNKPAAGEERAA